LLPYGYVVISSKNIRDRLKEIDLFLLDQYKASHGEKKQDWRTYEEQYAVRIREAMTQLAPLVDEAVAGVQAPAGPGRPHGLTLRQRVLLLLLQRLFRESNRMMASMLTIFSILSDIDVRYKTVERLYSDPEVCAAIDNLHKIILRKKGVTEVDACGDGTGYALTVKKHYATEAEKKKDKAKEANVGEKQMFVFSFKITDIRSKMYIAGGISSISEKRAFDRTLEMADDVGVAIRSIRLDRYYSCPAHVDRFGEGTAVFVIPKKNATLKGSWKWKRQMFKFYSDTMAYLKEFYQREHSENGWSVDKRRFGWSIPQRRNDRIGVSDRCTMLWHNLFLMGSG
jgi:transposase